jgi:hypothetical protein
VLRSEQGMRDPRPSLARAQAQAQVHPCCQHTCFNAIGSRVARLTAIDTSEFSTRELRLFQRIVPFVAGARTSDVLMP